MNEKDRGRLLDVLEHANEAIAYLGTLTQDAFLDDRRTCRACERCIEIIGEAAGEVSLELREATPHIPWRSVRGLRNILIHQYGHVDMSVIYTTIVEDIPKLATQIAALLNEESRT